MTLVLHVRGSSSGNPDFSPKEIENHIHLSPSIKQNEIRGKVQFCNAISSSHYGIVVELRGTITFRKGPQNVFRIFDVAKNSTTVLKSSVYHQISGSEDALQKDLALVQNTKQILMEPISCILEFILQLPTERPLPPSMTSKHVDVKYEIIVYERTQEGYLVYGEGYSKILNFYGLNSQPSKSLQSMQQSTTSQPFSGSGLEGCLQIPKSDYYRNEEIPYNVQILRDEKSIPIKVVSIFLLRTMIASYNIEEKEIERYINRSPSTSKNDEEIRIEGVFKRSRELPSYNDDGASGDGGLRIVYTVKCEVATEQETIGGQMEVVIRTMVPVDSVEEFVDGKTN